MKPGEVSESRGGVHMDFPEHVDTILNWTGQYRGVANTEVWPIPGVWPIAGVWPIPGHGYCQGAGQVPAGQEPQ